MQTPYTFFFAFIVVLALIGLAAWLVRRFAGNRLGANASRGRMPRLAVIDAAAVDGRRRLVLVRRDNVEHLLMIGGPTDIVVEPNIVRAVAGRDQTQPRGNAGADLPRMAPVAEVPSWADTDAGQDEPHLPEPPPRPSRPAFADEPRRPTLPLPERRPDPAPSFVPEPPSRPEPRLEPTPRSEPVLRAEPAPRSEPSPRSEPFPPRPLPRSETPREPLLPRASRPIEPPVRAAPPLRAERPATPAPAPIPAPTPAPVPLSPPPAANTSISADQNLADMAQRLEAALRRPTVDAPEPRIGAPSVAPESSAGRPASRSPEISVNGPDHGESSAPPVAPPTIKTGFENLEDEMASLLGRPKSSS
jgi:flagellar biogenesis protein FliO